MFIFFSFTLVNMFIPEYKCMHASVCSHIVCTAHTGTYHSHQEVDFEATLPEALPSVRCVTTSKLFNLSMSKLLNLSKDNRTDF